MSLNYNDRLLFDRAYYITNQFNFYNLKESPPTAYSSFAGLSGRYGRLDRTILYSVLGHMFPFDFI